MLPKIGDIVTYNSLTGGIVSLISYVYDPTEPYSDVSLHIFNNKIDDSQYQYGERISYGLGINCWQWSADNTDQIMYDFFSNLSGAQNGSTIIYNSNIGAWEKYNTMTPQAPNSSQNPGLSIDVGFF